MKQSRQRFYVGMDGGGTKIKLKLADESGSILAQATGGPAQIRLSVDKAWQSIHSVISDAFTQIHQDPKDPNIDIHVCLGLAGCEVQYAKQDFLSREHYFRTLDLYSDAYVACVGAHAGGRGGIIIVGTGVIGYSVCDTVTHQVGGWGFPYDDMGGGAWLGMQAFRRSMQAFDQRLPSTAMTKAILEKFEFNQNKLINWAVAADATLWATLAPIVVEYSMQGDQAALNLLKESGVYVSQLARSLLNHSKQYLPLVFFGGLSTFIMEYLDTDILSMITQRQSDAEDGALLLLQKYREI